MTEAKPVFGAITLEEMRLMALEMQARLFKDGDPFNGDDWSAMQICGCLLKLLLEYPGLREEADLYRRGYEAIGACDISNYLALCQEANGAYRNG